MGKYDSVLEQIAGKPADPATRTDAITLNTAFLATELEALEAEFYRVLKVPMAFRSAVPVKNSGFPPGAETIGYKVMDWTGEAKFISNAADDLPLVNVAVGKEVQKVHNVGAAYQVTLPELQAASMAGLPLEREEAVAAAEAIERKLDKVAAIGEAGLGIYGVLNADSQGVVVTTPAANGTGSGTLWSTKLGEPFKILADINKLLSGMVAESRGQIKPDRLILDYEVLALLESNQFAPDSSAASKNVLSAFFDSQPYIKTLDQIIVWDYARTASTTGGSRIAAVSADPRFLAFAIPMEANSLPPQFKNLSILVNMYGRVAGMQVRQSLALRYLDGTLGPP